MTARRCEGCGRTLRASTTPAIPWSHWTEQEQDAHWAALCAAVGTPDAQRPTPTVNGPHAGVQAA